MNAMDDRNDLKMDGNSDVRLCHRMYDLLGDRSLGASRVNRRTGVHLNAQLVYEHRVDLTIDPECFVRHDPKLGENLDVKNLHVRLKVYLNMNCDRMSRDHLRCGHLKMHHRDTNRTDVMNLVGKLKNSGAMNSDARMI
jgi:hypothetical protein